MVTHLADQLVMAQLLPRGLSIGLLECVCGMGRSLWLPPGPVIHEFKVLNS